MNLTVNQSTNTNFKARIVKTKYLESAFETALGQAKVHPTKAKKFYESLNAIRNNKNIHSFSIDALKGSNLKPGESRPYKIVIDGYEIKGHPVFGEFIYDGNQCVQHIIDFAKRFLGEKESKTILTKETLITKLQQLQKKIFEK